MRCKWAVVIGTIALDEAAGAGSLYSMDAHFRFKKQIGNLMIPNGMGWNNDHTKFYFIDTLSYSVTAYHFNAITGRLSNKKTIISIDEKEGAPDGMTIDNEGMLWIAHWDGWQVTR
nr:SMP-30/gluconolactonase/LRE family protein [Niabella ginsenosidivorans]